MTISSRILLGFVVIAAIVFFYMAARTLKTHSEWREVYNAKQAELERKQDDIRALEYGRKAADGSVTEKGVNQLRAEVANHILRRGRIWRGASPTELLDQQGTVQIKVEPVSIDTSTLPGVNSLPDGKGGLEPVARELINGDVVFVFDSEPINQADVGPNYPGYIGAFLVSDVATAEKISTATLKPVLKTSAAHRAQDRQALISRMQSASNRWILLEVMPKDFHGLFAGLTDAELESLLPPDVVDEYRRHGQPAEADDPEEFIVQGPDGQEYYSRPLRDFYLLIQEIDRRKVEVTDEIAGLKEDLERLKKDIQLAQTDLTARQEEKAGLEDALLAVQAEEQAARTHRENLEGQVAQLQNNIETSWNKVKEYGTYLRDLTRELMDRAAPRTVQKPGPVAAR